jgi:hypothetical protein
MSVGHHKCPSNRMTVMVNPHTSVHKWLVFLSKACLIEMGLVMVIICMCLLSTRSNGQHLYQLPGLAMTEDLIHRLSLSDRQSGLVTENGTLLEL